MTGIRYTRIQRFCLHDGPGIRTTVFLFGCNLRCPWCCNPENLVESEAFPVLEAEPDELAEELLRDREFFGEEGGVTYSGGDPLCQAEALVPLMRKLRGLGVNQAVETSLVGSPEDLAAIAELADLVIADFKPELHFAPGCGSDVEAFDYGPAVGLLASQGKRIWLRTVYISGATSDEFLNRVGMYGSVLQPEAIEVLRLHGLGGLKSACVVAANELALSERDSAIRGNRGDDEGALPDPPDSRRLIPRMPIGVSVKPTELMGHGAFKKEAGNNTIVLSDSQIRDVQAVVWRIALDVIGTCEKYGIPYFMDGGSCLGAVRHRGFIPWDDDIDIAMARADYDRFVRMFEEDHGDKYWVHELGRTSGHYTPQTMIRLKGTVFRGKDDIQPGEAGIYVDIYPIENVFDNPVARVVQGLACDFSLLLLSCRKFSAYQDYYLWFAEGVEGATREIKKKALAGRLLGFVPLRSAVRFANWTMRLCKNDQSRWVSIPSGWEHFFGGLNKRETLFPTINAVFEDYEVSIPNGWKHYLIGLYGEGYMSLPPEGDRERHIVSQLDFGSSLDDIP